MNNKANTEHVIDTQSAEYMITEVFAKSIAEQVVNDAATAVCKIFGHRVIRLLVEERTRLHGPFMTRYMYHPWTSIAAMQMTEDVVAHIDPRIVNQK